MIITYMSCICEYFYFLHQKLNNNISFSLLPLGLSNFLNDLSRVSYFILPSLVEVSFSVRN